MKKCDGCHREKDESRFRVRIDKRVKNPSGLIYRSNKCYECEAEAQAERTKKQRATQKGREMHNKWALEFHKRHREKCLAAMKERRKTQEYKDYMKEYRKKNKAKIAEQEKITKKRHHEKHRDTVTDEYAIRQLVSQGYGAREQVEANRELIELKKVQILKKRIRVRIIELQKLSNEEHSSTQESPI